METLTDAQYEQACKVFATVGRGVHPDEGLVALADLLDIEYQPSWVGAPSRCWQRIEEAFQRNHAPDDCPGCGAPRGYPPAGPCDNHGTAVARAR